MITIQTQSDGVLFNFQDSTRYLYGDGSILTPYNSLTLIADESNVLTFRKSASNDIFITAGYDELGYSSKEEAINDLKTKLFKATGGGSESGITSGDVQTMIDNSLEDYYTDDEVDAALSGKASASDVAALQNEVAAKADTSAVTAVANDVSTLSGQVETKVNTTDFSAYSAATDARIAEDEEVTAAALNDLQENKADTSAVTQSLSAKQDALEYYSENEIEDSESGESDKYGQIEISDELNGAHVYVDFISSDEEKSPYASIDAWVDDGEGNEKQNRVYAEADGVGISAEENADDGEGNIVYVAANVSVSSTEIGMSVSEDGGNTSTTLSITSTDVTINNDAVATEPYVTSAISGKADTSAVTAVNDALTAHTANTSVHVTSAEKTTWNNKSDFSGDYNDLTNKPTIPTVPTNISDFTNDAGYITSADIDGKADTSAVTAVNDALTAHTSDTDIHVTTAQTAAWNAKAEPYSAGTGIEISGNVISATGGGGATYSAGTNISIDTGNTISCTLPITQTKTNEYYFKANRLRISNLIDNTSLPSGNAVGFAMGDGARSTGIYSFTFGNNAYAKQYCTAAIGYYLNAENQYETAFGKSNVSNTGSTASGQTLFSVGNGASASARHNAFEIRQNGDIYVNDGTNDVRLQDTILALGGLKLVKLTQAEYDALATKDNDTLYIITNVVS